MTDDAVPAAYLSYDPGRLVMTLDVDGERFAVRARGTQTDYAWLTGPNEGYGFGSSGRPEDVTQEEHVESIRGFLQMIDPATGYIAEE